MADYSPLRYPGGKAKLYKKIRNLLFKNSLINSTYIEPFAGGAGLALNLLFKQDVNKIILNDIDRSIYSFWYSCIYHCDDFIELINTTPININNWHKQKEIQKNKFNVSKLELGFSTFYLNRTNRSGIIKGGVMGGLNQSGTYKIDCRFNKENLIRRIRGIEAYKDHIQLYNLDAIEFIKTKICNIRGKSFTFFDPPYYRKAEGLYTNFYTHENHEELRDAIRDYMISPYIITYDNSKEIIDMYNEMQSNSYDITYCANVKRKEKEILINHHSLSM